MSVRVVLAPSMTRERFEDAAQALGWRLHDVVAESDTRPYEEIWSVDGGARAVHYIEDPILGIAFLLVMGESMREFAQELAQRLETIDATGAVALARSERAASYLAATAPPHSRPDVLAAFEDLLADADARVRKAALTAASYPAYPELRAPIERLAERDPDADVRAAAREALSEIGRS